MYDFCTVKQGESQHLEQPIPIFTTENSTDMPNCNAVPYSATPDITISCDDEQKLLESLWIQGKHLGLITSQLEWSCSYPYCYIYPILNFRTNTWWLAKSQHNISVQKEGQKQCQQLPSYLLDFSLLQLGYYVFCFTAQGLKVCRIPGPTAYSRTKMLGVFEKVSILINEQFGFRAWLSCEAQ